MVIRTPYGGGIRALEHHAESFESILAHIPGLKVVVPSTPYDAKGMLISSIRDPDPVVFLEATRLYRAFREPVPEDAFTVELGKAKVLREGSDLTLVGWGAMMPKLLKAADLVGRKGTSVEVIDVRSISPYDEATVNASVGRTGRLVVVQEAPRMTGFASEVITRVSEDLLDSMEAPPKRVTGFDIPFPFYKMENWALPDVDRIVKGMREVLTW
jgi:pyruvate dehydrogenase E1 component beta subunit